MFSYFDFYFFYQMQNMYSKYKFFYEHRSYFYVFKF